MVGALSAAPYHASSWQRAMLGPISRQKGRFSGQIINRGEGRPRRRRFRGRGIEILEPGLQGRRDMTGGLHLPQGDPDAGAAVAISCHVRWRLLACDRIPDAPLDGENFGMPEPLDHLLKRIMARRIERPGLAHAVACRMRRIEMRAGKPAVGNRLGRRMGAAALQQFWQDMGVRPLGTLSRSRRDRLIDLDPAEPADEDAMRIGGKDHVPSRDCRARTPPGRRAGAVALPCRDRRCARRNRHAARRGRDRTARIRDPRAATPRDRRRVRSARCGRSSRRRRSDRHSAIR